jgi:hypothetical protein
MFKEWQEASETEAERIWWKLARNEDRGVIITEMVRS